MNWPSPQDYSEAVQAPLSSFSDDELRHGEPALTPLGLPKPISGAFATVYQFKCGGRQWAVRCFLKDVKDQQRRYEAINDHLRQANLPFMVGFEFLREGIRIRGRWYPILKMEWIEGEPLDFYLARSLSNAVALQALAKKWLGVLACLQSAGVAHGDLQHGNVLVSSGEIKLIDYDGMFVPSLRGLASNEDGHRNYQHPARTGRDFGPYLDAFPGWVILVSISALAVEPTLWNRLNGGDDCLLFRERDFREPGRSQAFAALGALRRREVVALADKMHECLRASLTQVPSVAGSNGSQPSSLAESPRLPEWVREHQSQIVNPPLLVRVSVPRAAETLRVSWIVDQLADPLPARRILIEPLSTLDRLFMLLAIICVPVLAFAIGTTVGAWAGGIAAGACLAGIFSFLLNRYSSLPEHNERATARATLNRAAQAVLNLDAERLAAEMRFRQIIEPLVRLEKEYDSLPSRQKAKEDALESRSAKMRAEYQAQLHSRDLAERRAAANNQFTARIRQLELQLDESETRYRSKMASALDDYRKNCIASYLWRQRIKDAKLPGIGAELACRLETSRICNAVDVNRAAVLQVRGIGDARARVLVDWATEQRTHAEASAPNSLPATAAVAIAKTFREARLQIESQLTALKRQQSESSDQISMQFARERKAIVEALSNLVHQYEMDRKAVCSSFSTDQKRLAAEHSRLLKQTASERSAMDAALKAFDERLFQAKQERANAERRLSRFRSLTFVRWCLHLGRALILFRD